MIKNILNRLLRKKATFDKSQDEIQFWTEEIKRYEQWYNGLLALYNTPFPVGEFKVASHNLQHSSLLSWFHAHQKPKYLKDLKLSKEAFKDMKLLDVGSGPFPSALAFDRCEVYCLDPLWGKYLDIGFPLHYYEDRAHPIKGTSEDIPVKENFFDAVISVNAIDHVDSFEDTAKEIERVLKPDGLFRMHVHYHKPYPAEPIEIDDARFLRAYCWVKNLKKINVSASKHGHTLDVKGEAYALWSNF